MQIHRNSTQPFALTQIPLPQDKPGIANSPARVPEALPTQADGVTYTGTQDLKSMTLRDQLQYGRNMGVFTKITLHSEGASTSAPRPVHTDSSAEGFVSSAVSTMKDFEEGLAALKQQSTEPTGKNTGFLADKFRGFQSAAARLNVFA